MKKEISQIEALTHLGNLHNQCFTSQSNHSWVVQWQQNAIILNKRKLPRATSRKSRELVECEPAAVVAEVVTMIAQMKVKRRFRRINQSKVLHKLKRKTTSLRLSQMESLVDQDLVKSAQINLTKTGLKIDQLLLSRVLMMMIPSHYLHQMVIQENQALIENASSRSN